MEDLELARIFYSETLGLPVINYVESKHLFLRAGTSVLLIFNPQDSKMKKSPPPHYGGGRQHFAFEVKTAAYDATRREIENKGITITDELTWPHGGRSFYFNDPGGNVVEILSDKGIWE